MSLLNPFSIFMNLWQHRELIKQFTKREVIGRYKGSYLGLLWSFITPLLMLLIYTFVFSLVFKAKWGTDTNQNQSEYALLLFCGLLAYNIFAETVSRAPVLIINNANYVKKVVFPLEIFPVIVLGSSLFHSLVSLLILLAGVILYLGVLNWTIVFLPLVILPILLLSLGIGWFLSAIGAYLRDIGYLINFCVQALLFLSPIFYPISAIPDDFKYFFYINPISYVVEDMRRIIIWGQPPDWNWLIYGTISGLIVTVLGYLVFQKARRGFADVL